MHNVNIQNIIYTIPHNLRKTIHTKSIEVIGLDTESDDTGKCFLICTSENDSFFPDDCPDFFFTRKYRGRKFVVYNLKYDEGSIIQRLPIDNLNELRETLVTSYNGFVYKSIPHKMLVIRKGTKAIRIFDIAGFFHTSLNMAAHDFLGKEKIDIETKTFTPEYVKLHLEELIQYCIQDAKLTKELADELIKNFEGFGVFPQALYSTAYISFTYFRNKCHIPIIKNLYDNHKELLQYAIDSYNGGKFEVTRKGQGNYYEYDIISAYPFEIANLVDIENAYILHEKQYRRGAVYGYLSCIISIPARIYSPVAIKKGDLNFYPVGIIKKVITKSEYEYLLSVGCDIKILDAYWLMVGKLEYPFRKEINRLIRFKDEYKQAGKSINYHIIKIFMNSLYGKFVQLIKKGDKFIAGMNWNIIYGSVICANCRVRVSSMQQLYNTIVAVHTDSIISTKKLNIANTGILGDFVPDIEGEGLILGTGIYQIGSKTKFRGFQTNIDLMKLVSESGDKLEIWKNRPYSWREVAFHGWDTDLINKFVDIKKEVNINFDKKRIWLNDWSNYNEVLKRNIYSIPYPVIEA